MTRLFDVVNKIHEKGKSKEDYPRLRIPFNRAEKRSLL